MVLYRLIAPSSQAQPERLPHLLTASSELGRYLETFILYCRSENLSSATTSGYRWRINLFIKFCHANNVDDLAAIDSTLARLYMVDTGLHNSPYSVHDYFKTIKRWFNWLVGENYLITNPMAKLRPPKVPDKILTPFTPEQIQRLLTVCDRNTLVGSRNAAIILTLIDTGLRRSEMASILLADVDFDHEIIKVMGKGAKERVVRIGHNAQKAILKYLLKRRDTCIHLWVNQLGQQLKSDGIRQMFETLGKRAEIEGVRCSAHTCRHYFATQALLRGAGEFHVQSLLGHSDLRMTRRYSRTINSTHAIEGHKQWSPGDNLRISEKPSKSRL